jgi:hypothetical protein
LIEPLVFHGRYYILNSPALTLGGAFIFMCYDFYLEATWNRQNEHAVEYKAFIWRYPDFLVTLKQE